MTQSGETFGGKISRGQRSVDSKKGCWIQMVLVDVEKVIVGEEIVSFDINLFPTERYIRGGR